MADNVDLAHFWPLEAVADQPVRQRCFGDVWCREAHAAPSWFAQIEDQRLDRHSLISPGMMGFLAHAKVQNVAMVAQPKSRAGWPMAAGRGPAAWMLWKVAKIAKSPGNSPRLKSR